MTVNLTILNLLSPVHDQQRIEGTLREYLHALQILNPRWVTPETIQEVDETDPLFIFVATGGTEGIFQELYPTVKGRVFFLTTPLHNSLAAAMEMMAWVQGQGGKGQILHGTALDLKRQVERIAKIYTARKKIKGSLLGVVGHPSDWLIASMPDQDVVKESWGINSKYIGLEKLIAHYQQIDVEQQQITKIVDSYSRQAAEIRKGEANQQGVIQAVKIYLALKKLINSENLAGITLRCFDLVSELNTTGCLAVSLLNDEGYIAACEGDIPAAISMLLAYFLTDSQSFMANPVQINQEKGLIRFAHCTAPTTLSTSYIIRSHFETGKGIGIQGILPEGPVTILKIGGRDLREHIIIPGRIISNSDDCNSCRTQIDVELANIDYFLTRPLANHHIIIPGDHSNILRDYFTIF